MLAVLLIAAACGGDDDDDDPAGSETEFDEEAVLTLPADLSGAGQLLSWDPAIGGFGRERYDVFAPLLYQDVDGTFRPGLAERAEVRDPSTIEITLQSGLEFSNGEVLDAQAVKATIERNIASKNSISLRFAELSSVSAITVNTPTSLTITLKTPTAGVFYPLLSGLETHPIAPQSIRENTPTSSSVIAAGPFKVDSVTPGSSIELSKNDKFYDADKVRIAKIKYVHVVAQPAAIENALRSATIDWYAAIGSQLTLESAEALGGSFNVDAFRPSFPVWINLCVKDGTPLYNLKVRQALNYATDRVSINDVLNKGQGEPAWSLFPSDHVFHADDLDEFYDRDIEKAKRLLAEAGFGSGLNLTIISGAQDQRLMELLQAQWKEAGVNLSIQITSNIQEDWYRTPKADANPVPLAHAGVNRLVRLFTSTAFANVCKWQVPAVDALTAQLAQLEVDSDEAIELWADVQKVIVEDLAYGVLTTFPALPVIESDRFVDVGYVLSSLQGPSLDYTKVALS
jgi:peptide/nickel transport system substrate-binding protein